MTHAIHIFRKDLHRLRWAVVGWCAIVAGIGLVDTVGADVALGGFGPQLAIRQMSTMLSAISALMLAILLARVVQDEPLVGRDAFWLTRPIESLSVMRAKLAFATSFLVVIPLAARVFVAAWYGTRPEAIIKIVPTFLFNQLIAIGVLWALAALTPSLVRYVIAIVGIIGTFVLLTASTLLIALFIAAETEAGGDYKPPDVTPAVVAGGLIILTALAVVVTQYRTRQVSRSLIAAAIGVIVVLFVPANWPWSFAAPQTSEVVSPLPALPSLSVSLDVSTPRTTESMTLSRRTPHSREIAVPALVGGLPSEFNIRAMVGRSRLEFSNGVVLEDRRRQTSARSYGYIRGSTGGRESAIEAAEWRARRRNTGRPCSESARKNSSASEANPGVSRQASISSSSVGFRAQRCRSPTARQRNSMTSGTRSFVLFDAQPDAPSCSDDRMWNRCSRRTDTAT